MTRRTKWNDDLIESELLKSIETLNLKRMPTSTELKSVGRNDLHCIVSRTKKYRGWAEKLGLQLKESETLTGQLYEDAVAGILTRRGYEVEVTSTKHPYDLLINGALKIDVKVANAYLLRDEHRVHTISLAKVNPTCDLYICVLLDEEQEVERFLIIPSHLVRLPMLNIGRVSKYNVYDNQFNYIKEYTTFFEGIS